MCPVPVVHDFHAQISLVVELLALLPIHPVAGVPLYQVALVVVGAVGDAVVPKIPLAFFSCLVVIIRLVNPIRYRGKSLNPSKDVSLRKDICKSSLPGTFRAGIWLTCSGASWKNIDPAGEHGAPVQPFRPHHRR